MIITANDNTTPNSINNLPVLPPMNDKGKNTLTRTKVVAITTKVICLAPAIDASGIPDATPPNRTPTASPSGIL